MVIHNVYPFTVKFAYVNFELSAFVADSLKDSEPTLPTVEKEKLAFFQLLAGLLRRDTR